MVDESLLSECALEQEFQRQLAYGLERPLVTDVAPIEKLYSAFLDTPAPPVVWYPNLTAILRAAKAAGCVTLPWFFAGRWFQYWPSWMSYSRRLTELTPEADALLTAVEGAVATGIWWVPFEEQIACCPPPLAHTDEQGELHSETGPALYWPDLPSEGCGRAGCSERGCEYCAWWAWHGVFVPRAWIEARETIDPSTVLTHPNAEEARALGEILGWANVFKDVKRKIIAKDPNPKTGGVLFEVKLKTGRSRFVEVLCGTGRTFVLQVADDAADVTAAIAGTYGLPVEVYAQLEHRT